MDSATMEAGQRLLGSGGPCFRIFPDARRRGAFLASHIPRSWVRPTIRLGLAPERGRWDAPSALRSFYQRSWGVAPGWKWL